MKSSVYLDATIPSFYYENRTGTILEAWRELTVLFWTQARSRYDLYASDETVRELSEVGYPAEKRAKCLQLIATMPRLTSNEEVIELVELYVREGLMPSSDLGDAFHLAFATWYRIEYLLTWNCKHLANANKFARIQAVNAQRRLVSPAIVTPEQLLEIEL